MLQWRGSEATPEDWGRCAVSIGVFDGVHRGHRYTIDHMLSRAAQEGIRSLVLTFDPHPAVVLGRGAPPTTLTPLPRKLELLEGLGVDAVCVLPFTSELSQQSAEDFVANTLVKVLHAAVVVVGENFRFGHRAAGNVETLRVLGERFGFRVDPMQLMSDTANSVVLSSTYVRTCIADGDVESAAAVLGRPHELQGIVVRGDGRGRAMGVPTANLYLEQHLAVPADGVYAGWVLHDGSRHPAAISVGTNPTFNGTERRVEAHILDFDADLYGYTVAVEFTQHLRGMVRFDRVEELIAQMKVDIERVRLLQVPKGDGNVEASL